MAKHGFHDASALAKVALLALLATFFATSFGPAISCPVACLATIKALSFEAFPLALLLQGQGFCFFRRLVVILAVDEVHVVKGSAAR